MQITREHLITIADVLKHLGADQKRRIADEMHLSPSEFNLFCDEIPNMGHEDIEPEIDFEQLIEQYLTEQFFDTTLDWQKKILTSVLANFDGLDANILNKCLDQTDQEHIGAIEIPPMEMPDDKDIE